jgi:hypothetical protein
MSSTAYIIKFWQYVYLLVFIAVVWMLSEDGSCVEPHFLRSDNTDVSVVMSLPHQVILAYGTRTWNTDITVCLVTWLRLSDLHSIHTETAEIF